MAGDTGFWDVAWNWPLPFVTAVAMLVVPMAGIIWFICQLRYKQQIATLKDRVELADERLGDAKEKIVKAEEEKTALHTARHMAFGLQQLFQNSLERRLCLSHR